MENASKALIIAGAILLAILIIGLGIYIYNQAANSMGNTGVDQMEIRKINGQFEPYLDRPLTAVEARALYDTIKNCKDVEFDDGGDISSKSEIEAGGTYQATVSYKGEDHVSQIDTICIDLY